MNETVMRRNQYLLGATASALLSVAILRLCFISSIQNFLMQKFGKVNIIALMIAVGVGILSFLPLCRLAHPIAERLGRTKLAAWLPPTLAILNLVAIFLSFCNEPLIFDSSYRRLFWFEYPRPVAACVVGGICLLFLYLVRDSAALSQQPCRKADYVFRAYAVILFVLTLLTQYTPNVLNGDSGNLYHMHAYFNSVYNAVFNVPYSDEVSSIYGHYAIFLAPVLKLARALGITNMVKVFMLLMAALKVLILICVAYALWIFVKNNLIRILALTAAGYAMIGVEFGIYLQLNPHRTIVSAIFMAMAAFLAAHPQHEKKICAVGYIISVALIIWSTECGMVALICWAAIFCCRALQQKSPRAWLAVALHLALCAASFLAAVGLVDLYNLALGGSMLSLSSFLFPLLTQSYMTGFLEQPLFSGLSQWVFMISLFLLFVCKGLFTTVLCCKVPQDSLKNAIYFGLGAIGLGSITYALNRPTYGNFFIALPLTALLLAILADRALPEITAVLHKETRKALEPSSGIIGHIGVIVLCVLFVLTLLTVANYGSRQDRRQPLHDEYSMTDMSKYIDDNFSLDTVALGRGALELFAAKGLDTGLHVMDYSDITISPAQFAYADSLLGALDGKCLLTTDEVMQLHMDAQLGGYDAFMQTHVLDQKIVPSPEVSDLIFYYYVPILPAT